MVIAPAAHRLTGFQNILLTNFIGDKVKRNQLFA